MAGQTDGNRRESGIGARFNTGVAGVAGQRQLSRMDIVVKLDGLVNFPCRLHNTDDDRQKHNTPPNRHKAAFSGDSKIHFLEAPFT